MAWQPPAITIAHKMINLHTDLSATDKRVAGALLEHFNRRSGRCDPSLGRLADLLQVSIRTVIRSANRLHRIRLFVRDRHGSYSNRNHYSPNWGKFRELEIEWRTRFDQQKRARLSTQNLSSSTCQTGYANSDSAVTQTLDNNSLNLTLGRTAKQSSSQLPSKETHSKALSEKNKNECGSSPVSARPASNINYQDIALTAAERRWNAALQERFGADQCSYAHVIEAMTVELQEEATRAELGRHGDGLRLILTRLQSGGCSSHSGTPVTAASSPAHGSFLRSLEAGISDGEGSPVNGNPASLNKPKEEA